MASATRSSSSRRSRSRCPRSSSPSCWASRADREQFRAWSQELATLVFAGGLPDRHARGREALRALSGYLGEHLAQRRARPRDDLLSVLAAADELTAEE